MRRPFNGDYPMARPFIKSDPNMPKALWDPIYGPSHRGIDWALPTGTTLLAAISGQVTAAGWSPDGAGNLVVIKNGTLYVKYFHMSSVAVRVGQQVNEGDVVGASGATGNASGPHLHFQVEQPFANAIDPAPMLGNQLTEDKSMTTQEGTALADSIWWNLVGRKIKDSELAEYVPIIVGGNPDKVIKKVLTFDEIKAHLAQLVAPTTVDKDTVLSYLQDNLK